MSPDPHGARQRLRMALTLPLGEARLDGADLAELLREVERVDRYLEALHREPGATTIGPPAEPVNLGYLRRLRSLLEAPPGTSGMSRRELRSLVDGYEHFLRLEAYLNHHPGCPRFRADPWAYVDPIAEYRAGIGDCACGFDRAYTGFWDRETEGRRAALRALEELPATSPPSARPARSPATG